MEKIGPVGSVGPVGPGSITGLDSMVPRLGVVISHTTPALSEPSSRGGGGIDKEREKQTGRQEKRHRVSCVGRHVTGPRCLLPSGASSTEEVLGRI